MDEPTLPLLGCITEVREQHFRVARIAPGRYGILRVSDNMRIGTYAIEQVTLQVTAEVEDIPLVAEIAASALRKGLR